jgi:hypothetical protein
MALTEMQVRTAKAEKQQYKLYDEGGLILLIRPSGGKLWRLKYRFAGKEQQLSIGRYPDTGLKEARQRRDAARKLLSAGIDPARQKRLVEAENARSVANTFKVVAEELIAKSEREGRATATLFKARWFLSLLPAVFTSRPVKDIKAPELLAELRKIESAGHHETAKRVRAFAGRVFRFAIATGRAHSDPSAALRGALVSPKVTHYAAILTADGAGSLLRPIDGFEGQPITKLALQLAPHVFVRPGELRAVEWSEFDLTKAIWRIDDTWEGKDGYRIHKQDWRPSQLISALWSCRESPSRRRPSPSWYWTNEHEGVGHGGDQYRLDEERLDRTRRG